MQVLEAQLANEGTDTVTVTNNAVSINLATVIKERVIAVVQPHRYSRLADLFEEFCACFNDADVVIVADVYAAGEAPLPGIDRDALVEGLRRYGHRRVVPHDHHPLLGVVRVERERKDVGRAVCERTRGLATWRAETLLHVAAAFAIAPVETRADNIMHNISERFIFFSKRVTTRLHSTVFPTP